MTHSPVDPRPTPDEVAARVRCGPARCTNSRGNRGSSTNSGWCWPPPGTGPPPRPRAVVRATRARQDHFGDDHRQRDVGTAANLVGPAIQHAGDLAAILSGLTDGEVLFLDEIHRMSRPAEEMLYLAMEDFRVDVVIGKGPGAAAIPIEIPPFTLVGATTRAGLLPGPLRDRFGFTAQLDYYAASDLEGIVRRSARKLGVQLDAASAAEIARRSRGTPRIANRLLRRVRDYAQVHHDGTVTSGLACDALELYEVDPLGLDRLDQAVLEAICLKFGGGPVGLSTLAIAVAEETETVEEVAEPFLVRLGFMMRTPRGRVATPAGWRHLGLEPPAPQSGSEQPDLFS